MSGTTAGATVAALIRSPDDPLAEPSERSRFEGMEDGFVGEVRDEIERRLALLAPARQEAERLERALAALDGVRPDVPTRAPRGARAARLLQAVRERPGITQREVADVVGMTPAAVYGPVRRAVLKGQIVKRDGRLHPVDEDDR